MFTTETHWAINLIFKSFIETFFSLQRHFGFIVKVAWHTAKYGDPYSEFMVCIYPSKVHTHSSEHTHTPWTQTWSSGQLFMLQHPGSSWGFGVLLKGTSVVILRRREHWTFTPPHLQFLLTRDSNSQPFDSLPLGHDFPVPYYIL